MSVQAVNASAVSQQQQKKTGGSGKAWTSVFVPGLGQFLDDRNGAGAAYMGAAVAAGIGNYALQSSLTKDIYKAYVKKSLDNIPFDRMKYLAPLEIPKGKFYGAIALALATTGLWLANIVDAYKGGKKKA